MLTVQGLYTEYPNERGEVVKAAQERGYLLNNTGPSRLRFAPPLTITEGDLDAFADAWPAILEEASS